MKDSNKKLIKKYRDYFISGSKSSDELTQELLNNEDKLKVFVNSALLLIESYDILLAENAILHEKLKETIK